MRVLCRWLILGSVAASPAYAGDISGTYVGTGSNSAFLVEIVETTGGQLTGRYEQTVLRLDGKLDRTIEVITGVSDGHTIVATIKPSEFGATGDPTSGTVEGPILHLSGGGNGHAIDLNLAKSDEAAYRADVVGLTNQARAITEARAHADQSSRLSELTKNMLIYSTEADAQLVKFAPIEERFRAITKWMDQALERQKLIYGGGQASLARGQVRLAINQASMAALQLHSGLQSANQDIGAKIHPLFKAAVDFSQRCQSDEAGQNNDLHAACLKFSDAAKKFKKSVETLGSGFDQAEKIWLEERRKQEYIIRIAAQ